MTDHQGVSRFPPLLPADPLAPFPPPATALAHPNGLLAVGGDLSIPRLLNAYRGGIFPWYADDQPVLWWSPDPRVVFRSEGVHLSRRFKRQLRGLDWRVRADHRFGQVIRACAGAPRPGQRGTWITDDMILAYERLHRAGHAHSVEVMAGDRLVGGLYGVSVGRMFFGESMFSAVSGASKVALAALGWRLSRWGWPVFDAQVGNPHLLRMGAEAWPRDRFLGLLARQVLQPGMPGSWQAAFGGIEAGALAADG